MARPDWQKVELIQGVLREPGLDGAHLIVWFPREREGDIQHWERIGNVPGAVVTTTDGLCATAATAVRARQRSLGLFGKLLNLVRKPTAEHTWMLPNGGSAEQAGARRTDLMLVWPADETASVDEEKARARFSGEALVRLGKNLLVVFGAKAPQAAPPAVVPPTPLSPALAPPQPRDMAPPTAVPQQQPQHAPPAAPVPQAPAQHVTPAAPVPQAPPQHAAPAAVPQEQPQPAPPAAVPQPHPRDQAEHLLILARQSGDQAREATALTDVGILCVRSGEPGRAVPYFEEALAIVRSRGDQAQEVDVLESLGLAVLAMGLPGRALEYLGQALEQARASGNRFSQKTILENLGRAYSSMRDPVQALAFFEEALMFAREVNDQQQEADLLWLEAVEYAELGQREQVFAFAQAAIDLFKSRGKPQAGFLTEQLRKYAAAAEPDSRLQQPGGFGGVIVAGAWSPPPSMLQGTSASGPGVLRMAIAAVKSAARFLGSGLKTVPASTHQQRLAICQTCEQHTGMRCKVCGCFTSVKAWLPHEDCPIGKWPAPQ